MACDWNRVGTDINWSLHHNMGKVGNDGTVGQAQMIGCVQRNNGQEYGRFENGFRLTQVDVGVLLNFKACCELDEGRVFQIGVDRWNHPNPPNP